MNRKSFVLLSVSCVLLATILVRIQNPPLLNQVPAAESPKHNQQQVQENYGKLPLYFIENRGRLDSRVAYYVQGSNKSIYFTAEGVTFALTAPREEERALKSSTYPASYRKGSPASELVSRRDIERWVLKLDFVGANPNARPGGQEPTDAVVSYFRGTQEEWATGLPTYASLAYRDLWPGIDLVYTGTGGRLKYTFVVQPGADPSQIKMAYRGASGVRINAAGQLEVSTPVEDFHEDTPYVYQEVDGRRRKIAAAYSLEGEDSEGVQFGFRVGDYDRSKVLVLDPVVFLYAGFIGGSGFDAGYGIAVDGSESAYVAGLATSFEGTFPVTVGPDLSFNGGDVDAFVAKVNPAGTALVYAGYIGGASSVDYGLAIAVDGSGNAYVAGQTDSSEATFPVFVGPDLTYNGNGDAFVAKVNAAGTALVYAGYIGGAGFEFGSGIAVDSSGNAYVTGATQSSEFGNVSVPGFPIKVGPDLSFNGGEQDAFVAKVNAAGSALVYAGYIGGSGFDVAYGIAVDAAGNAYVAGETNSNEGTFPVTVGPDLTYNGNQDAFVAKVNADGTALLYAGYIGGAGFDVANGIAVDALGKAYLTGETAETSFEMIPFPLTVGPDLIYNGGLSDAFVAKVSASGAALEYSGYIGGADVDVGRGIAVDTLGNAYVTGDTASADTTFPVTMGPDLTDNGEDAFVAKVNVGGTTLDYAGFIGGASVDVGRGIAVDASGNAYVTGETLSSESPEPPLEGFPVTVGPDLTYNSDDPTFPDAFVVKIGEGPNTITYYMPHLALGGGWQTTITYVNYSPETVTCETSILSDSGSPLSVSFGGAAVSTRSDTLAPGGTLHQESTADLNAAVVSGWARAECSGPIKASLLFRLYQQGQPTAEAGVNAMTVPASEFVTFADQNTGVAYANPSAQPTQVNFAALGPAGIPVANRSLTLLPGEHGSANMGPFLNVGSFVGSIRITSSVPIVSLSLNAEAFPAFSSLPPGQLDGFEELTYYFPHLALGGGWQTTLTYINHSLQSVTCQTAFFSDSGSPLPVSFGGAAASSRVDILAAAGILHQESTADLNAGAVSGWARAECSGPIKASLLYRLYQQGEPTAEAGVNAMTAPAIKFVTFAEQQTGVAYANPSGQTAEINFKAISSAGDVLANTSLPLQPGQHAAANLGPLLGLSNFTGSIQIVSTAPILSLSLNAEAFPAFSSLPPGELDDSTLLR